MNNTLQTLRRQLVEPIKQCFSLWLEQSNAQIGSQYKTLCCSSEMDEGGFYAFQDLPAGERKALREPTHKFELDHELLMQAYEYDELDVEDAVRETVLSLWAQAYDKNKGWAIDDLHFLFQPDFGRALIMDEQVLAQTRLGQANTAGDKATLETLVKNNHITPATAAILLDQAAAYGHDDLLAFWQQRGADVNHPLPGKHLKHPFHTSAGTRAITRICDPGRALPDFNDLPPARLGTVKTLYASCTPREPKGGKPLLHQACGGLNLELAQWLLQQGADASALDKNGMSVINEVVGAGEHDERSTALIHLLLDAGCGANHLDKHRWERSALMMLALYGPDEAIEPLLKAGADPNLVDTKQKSAVDYALEQQHTTAYTTLLAYGANTTPAQQLLGSLVQANDAQDSAFIFSQAEAVTQLLPTHEFANNAVVLAGVKENKLTEAYQHGKAALARKLSEYILANTFLALALAPEAMPQAQALWQQYKNTLDRNECLPTVIVQLIYIYTTHGNDYERALLELIPWAEARYQDDATGVLALNAACVYAHLGQTQNALRLLKAAILTGYREKLDIVRSEPNLRSLHTHPSYLQLLGDDPESVIVPTRQISNTLAQAMLLEDRDTQRAGAEQEACLSLAIREIMQTLDQQRAHPGPVIQPLIAAFITCFEQWAEPTHNEQPDRPLAAIVVKWGEDRDKSYNTDAKTAGYADLQLEPEPLLSECQFEHGTGFDFAPLLGRYGALYERYDYDISDYSAIARYLSRELDCFLSMACAEAVKSAAFAALKHPGPLYFFSQEENKDEQNLHLFYVAD